MKKFIGILIALLTTTTLTACQSNTTQNKETTSTKTESTSTSDTSNKQKSETNKETENTQIIGSDEYGYVKVPKNWFRFKDVKGGNDIQYSDGSAYNIVTLNIFRPSQLGISETEYASIDPVYVANSVLSGQKNTSAFQKVWGAKSKIGEYDVYVVNSITTSGKYFVTWVFRANDGKIHYASLEGNEATIEELLPMIEKSWTLKK
ncbi:hypothetical protein [Gemella morbillorum]|uniref:hypothetical protein n=1 Tax=Gemella morbillorum TaxID=29391 RepID=UPI0023EFAEA1|nr:hypothetical protein [Gemella morbillorum]